MKALLWKTPRQLDLRSISGYIVESYDEFRTYQKIITQFIVTDKNGACHDVSIGFNPGVGALFWKGLVLDDIRSSEGKRIYPSIPIGFPPVLFPGHEEPYNRVNLILKSGNQNISATAESDVIKRNWSDVIYSEKGDILDIQGLPLSIDDFFHGEYATYTDRLVGWLMGPPPISAVKEPLYLYNVVNLNFRKRKKLDYYDLYSSKFKEIEITLDDLDKMLRRRSKKYRKKTPPDFVKKISEKS